MFKFPKPRILHNDGSVRDQHSQICPTCGITRVTKDLPGSATFDERGRWYHPVKFTCGAGHEWTERVFV